MKDHGSPESELHADDLTWREQDILNLLADRLSNREIAERLFLAETTVKDYVGRILSKLNVKNRRMAVERGRELGLLGDISDTPPIRMSNLPSSPTPFIGRSGELDRIKGELGKTRLLTLSGPGGMGKTRLALKTAQEVAVDFRDGSFFVNLAPIRSVEYIVQAIAEAVDFPLPTNEDPKRQLIRYLQKKDLFLVIDNFEHLLAGVGVVSEILRNTSDVKILTTSRERLNLLGETNLTVAGMKVDGELDLENAEKVDAVALFLSSAAKVRPEFVSSPEELTRIVHICQAVQGMPLAIELAASWLHVLSVDEINEEINKGLDILETEVRDAPERHRSIRAVFDGSWSMMDVNEREIFMRLSIFKGGFTREAARQVAGASLKQIGDLVNKSLIKHDPGTSRMEIHELLRQYAQEHLENLPDTNESTKGAYAAYFAEFMQDRWSQIRGSRQIPALREIAADIENVRAAWGYYLREQNASQLRKFLHVLWMVYWVRGWTRAAIDLFSGAVKVLPQSGGDPEVQAVRSGAMGHLGFFMTSVGLADKGYELGNESIEILERLDYPIELAFAYQGLTLSAYYLDRPNQEMNAAQKLLEIAEASNDKWLQGYALWFVNLAEYRLKNYARSKRHLEASMKLNDEINNYFGIALCFTSLGGFAINNKEYAQAKEYFTQCLRLSDQMGFRWLSSNAVKYLGVVALYTGELEEARLHLVWTLKVAYDLGLDRDIAQCFFNFARLRVAQDDRESAVELLSLLLGQPASYQSWSAGGTIRENAQALLADLESRLSPETYARALERGELLETDDVIKGLVGLKS